MHQRCRHRRIDPPTQSTKHAPLTHRLPDLRDRIPNERCSTPRRLQPRDLKEEIGEYLLTLRRVRDFRVELYTDDLFFSKRRYRCVRGRGKHREPLRQLCYPVTMAHPDAQLLS